MGSLEQVGESRPTMETGIPPEVREMDNNLIGEAKIIFQNNHELVKEAMFGMGNRKAKEVLENLAECRERVAKEIKNFRKEKEKIYH